MENAMSNPLVIMLINMTIVFAVLAILNLFIRLIHFVDPTRKDRKKPAPVKAAAPAPAKAAAPVAAAPVVEAGISGETVAAIAGALAAYGIGFSQIKAIRPAARSNWAGAGRIEGLRNTR